MTDSDLARRARAGSVSDFNDLLRRYEARVYNFVLGRVSSREDAEDLTQTIFIKAYTNMKRYNPKHKFETWIFCIARRETISRYRTDHRKIHVPLFSEIEDSSDSPSDAMEKAETAKHLWGVAFEKLDQRQFDALWMRYREDMSVAETAQVLEASAGATKVLLHRARQTLSEALAEYRQAGNSI